MNLNAIYVTFIPEILCTNMYFWYCLCACINSHSLALRWRHNGRVGVSNHQSNDSLLKRLFRRRSKKTKLRVTGLCAGNSPATGEFPAQMASNAENVSIWWRHHGLITHACTRQSGSKRHDDLTTTTCQRSTPTLVQLMACAWRPQGITWANVDYWPVWCIRKMSVKIEFPYTRWC